MSRFPKPNLGIALFGGRVLFAFFASPLVFAHEAHQPTGPAIAAAASEQSFLKENEVAMTRVKNGMAASRRATSTANSSR